MGDEFTIPWEAADAIVLSRLKEDYQMSNRQLDKWYEGKEWLHRDDVEHTSVIIFHLRAVIEYYGGSVE